MIPILEKINSLVWGAGLVSLLLLTGLIFTIRLKCPQLRLFPDLIKLLKNNPSAGSLKTVSMALGTSMGTGNIVGVCSALSIGGAGAVFWMWVSALLGMAVVYAENSLSYIYSGSDGKGPMAYIKKGLSAPLLASFFAAACVGAAFGMGGMVQVNSAVENVGGSLSVRAVIAAGAFVLIYMVVSGGADRIGSAAELLLPFVTIVYTGCCVAVIFLFRSRLPEVVSSVFREAFSFRGAAGGTAGYALSVGIRRGIFSNEAGLGSSPLVHSSAKDTAAGVQETFAMLEVFIDTIFCCTLTAGAVLCASPDGSASGAFRCLFEESTDEVLTLLLTVFSFCTIIGWYYCGETAFLFLRNKEKSRVFPVIFAAVASTGALFPAGGVWLVSDIFNGVMAFPNIAALLLLRKEVGRNKSGKAVNK